MRTGNLTARFRTDISRILNMPTPDDVGLGFRYLGLLLLGCAVASSALTFSWVVDHQPERNLFPEFSGLVIYLSDFFLIAGQAIWTVGWYMSPSLKLRYGPGYIIVPLMTLVVWTVVSMGWAIDGVQTAYTSVRLLLMLVMFIILATESTRATVLITVVLVGMGVLQATVSVLQVVERAPVGLPQLGEISEGALGYDVVGTPRAYGLGFNPNPVGMQIAIAGTLLYAFLLVGPGGWKIRLVALPFFLVMIQGVVATGSRSAGFGWLLGFVVITMLAWINAREARGVVARRFAAVVAIMLVAAFTLSNFAFVDRTTARLAPGEVSDLIRGRVSDWELSVPILQEHYRLGVGGGNYSLALKANLSPESFGGIYTPVHSVLLLIVAELGVVGGIAWFIILVSPLIWMASKRQTQRFERQSFLWIGPLLVILFVSMVDFPPWGTQDGRLATWAVLGLWAGNIGAYPSPVSRRWRAAQTSDF